MNTQLIYSVPPSNRSATRLSAWLLLILFTTFMLGCSSEPNEASNVAYAQDASADVIIVDSNTISALGIVKPAETRSISFLSAGIVAEVPWHIGDKITKDDLLLELNSAEDMALILQKLIEHDHNAQAVIDELAVSASVAIAPQALTALEQIAQVEIDVLNKQMALEAHQNQIFDSGIEATQLEITRLELLIEQTESNNPAPSLTIASVDLERSQLALDKAQEAYDNAEKRGWNLIDVAEALQQAEFALEQVQAQVKAAQNSIDAHALNSDILETQLAQTKLGLEQQQYGSSLTNQTYTDTLTLLQANVNTAQFNLSNLYSQLDLQVANSTLRAPFDGYVTGVNAQPGSRVEAGMTVLQLISTESWTIETLNVSELDIKRIAVGQTVNATVLSDDSEELTGTLMAITPVAVVQQGDTTYSLLIALDETSINLLPGMNAQVEIMLENN